MSFHMEPAPLIEIRNLWYGFNGQPVLKDVSFNIFKGEFLALIGPNGGGKTTLLKIMLGLLRPTHGSVRVFGVPPKSASHRIGYVPQDVHINKNFPISAMDVVMMGRLRMTGKKRLGHSGDDLASVQEAMEKMEIWGYRNRRIGELSGGQRQRVFIARALATCPEILFLDEPTASIDKEGQGQFYDLLKHLNEKIAIVLASHDVMIISSYVKSVACVNKEVHYHDGAEITDAMLDMYACPVEMIAHGMPHRVLKIHKEN
jgi:zinc transport system ATP-binding protein